MCRIISYARTIVHFREQYLYKLHRCDILSFFIVFPCTFAFVYYFVLCTLLIEGNIFFIIITVDNCFNFNYFLYFSKVYYFYDSYFYYNTYSFFFKSK